MSNAALAAQLYALRSQVDALIAMVAASVPQPEAQSEGCPHPEEQQLDASTFSQRKTFCLACRTERAA